MIQGGDFDRGNVGAPCFSQFLYTSSCDSNLTFKSSITRMCIAFVRCVLVVGAALQSNKSDHKTFVTFILCPWSH